VTEAVDLSAVIGSVMARVVYGKEIPVMFGVPHTSYVDLKSEEEVFLDAGKGEVRTEE